jgi:acyl-CoA dehydrogenase
MDITLELNEEEKLIVSSVEEICRKFDDVYWREKDQKEEFPIEFWNELVKHGWAGINVPAEYGGAGLGATHVVLVVETISRLCGYSAGNLYNLGPCFGTEALVKYGTKKQKDELLPKLAKGMIVAIGLTEPVAGLDTPAIKTTAVKEGDEWIINGSKMWITGLHMAEYMLTVTRTTPIEKVQKRHQGLTLFLVPTNAKEIRTKKIKKLSMRCLSSFEVFLDNVVVPDEYRIGNVGEGFYVLLDLLDLERIITAAMEVGVGYQALERSVKYAKERISFGRPIGSNQAIQFALAEAKIELDAARLMIYRAAKIYDESKDLRKIGEASNATLYFAAKAGHKATDIAIQVHGGMGFSEEMTVERLWRDSRLGLMAPVSREMILHYIGTHVLGLPRSF